jgi:apolipoprotein N-acyltransferase
VIAPPAADRLLPVPDLSAADREQVRDWFVHV